MPLSDEQRTAADSRSTLTIKLTDGHDGVVLVGGARIDHRYGHQLVLRAIDLAECPLDASVDLVRRWCEQHLLEPDKSNLLYVASQWDRYWRF